MSEERKIMLSEREMPRQWYNILGEMPEKPALPKHPVTEGELVPEDLAPIFPMPLIEQELSAETWIDIPKEVLDIYTMWRPSPLYRASGLEKALDTPAKIYYKYEGVSPAGSHKLNTAVAQVYYNKISGVKKLTTETGAGQWGSALSMACSFFGLECTVFMVKISYQTKPYRRSLAQAYGGKVFASPSNLTEAGRSILAEAPDSPGSLGMAISEAVEEAVKSDDTKYALGSVLNHVLLHQTIIGLEAQKQMDKVDEYPDIVIGCCGGGSNFAGLSFPFVRDKFRGQKVRCIAVEPLACPTLTRGKIAYDYGDTAQLTPLLYMYTLGRKFVPPSIHAGGLRYHGVSPIISKLQQDGYIESEAYGQKEVFESAILFSKSEGILPAPESSHAIHSVVKHALACRENGEAKTILFNLSGHGQLDLGAYDNYLSGNMNNAVLDEENLNRSLANLPDVK